MTNKKILRLDNPFHLIAWDINMSLEQIERNNNKYWEWEIKHNNFKCP